ncbi:elongation factor Ts [Candidatus Woesebacteria bacterium]|nr:elongation factor Ts [Candidatus Woesebacteria bacterium]
MAKKKLDVKTLKDLREKTGAGIMDVKRVMDEVGDPKKAEKILKEKGFKKAAKRSDRATDAGLVDAYVHHSGKVASLVEVFSETDFVARNELFQELAHGLALQVASSEAKDSRQLLKEEFIKDPSKTIEDLVKEVILKTGENIKVGRITRIKLGEK